MDDVMMARFRQRPDALQRNLPDEVLVTRPVREHVTQLSGPAVVIWNLLDVPRTVPQLTASLARAYGMSEGQIIGGIHAVLNDLIARELVEEVIESDV